MTALRKDIDTCQNDGYRQFDGYQNEELTKKRISGYKTIGKGHEGAFASQPAGAVS